MDQVERNGIEQIGQSHIFKGESRSDTYRSFVKLGLLTATGAAKIINDADDPDYGLMIGNKMLPLRGAENGESSYLRYQIFRALYYHVNYSNKSTALESFIEDDGLVSARDSELKSMFDDLVARIESDVEDVAIAELLDYLIKTRQKLIELKITDPAQTPTDRATELDKKWPYLSSEERGWMKRVLAWDAEIYQVSRLIADHVTGRRVMLQRLMTLIKSYPPKLREAILGSKQPYQDLRDSQDVINKINSDLLLLSEAAQAERVSVSGSTPVFDRPADSSQMATVFERLGSGQIAFHRPVNEAAHEEPGSLRENTRGKAAHILAISSRRRGDLELADRALAGDYTAAILDVDGTVINNYHDEYSPLSARLHFLSSAGIRICMVSGRGVAKIEQLLKDAGGYPDLVIYGKNGFEISRSQSGKWIRSEPDNEFINTEQSQIAFGNISQRLMDLVERNEILSRLITVIKVKGDCQTISIIPSYRSASSGSHSGALAMTVIERLIMQEEPGLIQGGFVIRNCGEALQIMSKRTSKARALDHFKQSINGPILRIGDQGQIGTLDRVNRRIEDIGIGNDADIINHQNGFSVSEYSYVPGMMRPLKSKGWRAPYDFTKATMWILDNVIFKK